MITLGGGAGLLRSENGRLRDINILWSAPVIVPRAERITNEQADARIRLRRRWPGACEPDCLTNRAGNDRHRTPTRAIRAGRRQRTSAERRVTEQAIGAPRTFDQA